jgi:hypothetical protein
MILLNQVTAEEELRVATHLTDASGSVARQPPAQPSNNDRMGCCNPECLALCILSKVIRVA